MLFEDYFANGTKQLPMNTIHVFGDYNYEICYLPIAMKHADIVRHNS